MIRLKTPAEIARLAAGGAIISEILDLVSAAVGPAMTTAELDNLARRLIQERGVTPAFLQYAPSGHTPYPAALCVSVNDELVHGIPGQRTLEPGDIVSLDLGIIFQDMYLDSARTVAVGKVGFAAQKLIDVAIEALRRGIIAAAPGKRIGDIGAAIQTYVEGEGASVIRELVGHGVGFAVHEEPQVPNYGLRHTGTVLKPGLVIAIEPMITYGDPAVAVAADGWTVCIASGELAAHQEHTIAVTEEGPIILT